jgi:small subunit ribosomal protein S6
VNENQREYETVFILDPALEEGPVNEQIERASGLIRDNGGIVDEVERWGRRRLAYEIGRKRDGVYTLVRYHAPGAAVKELERRLRVNEQVLRVMTVVVDPRYKEMLQALANAPAPVAGGEDGDDDERPRRRGRPDADD